MNRKKQETGFRRILWALVLMLSFGGNFYLTTSSASAEMTVYITRTGSKYHTHKCGNGTYYPATLSEAKARGLTPCSKCFGGSSYRNSSSSHTSHSSRPKKTVVKPIKINKSSLLLVKGQGFSLKIKNAAQKVRWKSSKRAVASVSSNGRVIAKKAGATVITAKVGSQKKSCRVTVEAPKLSVSDLTMDIGETNEIFLTGCRHEVRWSSEDSELVKVNDGEITAKDAGETVIVAKVHNHRYRCNVNVTKPKVTQILLDKAEVQLGYNKSSEIRVSVTPKNAFKYYEMSAASSDESIVTAAVGYEGDSLLLRAGKKTGTAKITVTLGDATAECQVKVIPSVITSFSLDQTEMRLKPDETGELMLTVSPSDALDYYAVEWKSSDPFVVTAEPYGGMNKRYGKLKAVGEGEADVTVSLGTTTATCHVVVAKPEITGLALDQTEMRLKPDETGELMLTVSPSDALDYYAVEWKSSDPFVVTAEPYGGMSKRYGKLKAVGEGEADVTVSLGTTTATCHVVVVKPEITGLALDQTEMRLKPDETGELMLTVSPSDALDYYAVEWKSSDPSVVTVEPYGGMSKRYGKLKAVGEGEADVTVTLGDKSVICHVTVMD